MLLTHHQIIYIPYVYHTYSKLLDCIRSVVAKGLSAYGYQHRILMTGTPLQNNTSGELHHHMLYMY